jgi:hypothetical protein
MTSISNFSATLVKSTDAKVTRPLYVKAVDATAKTVSIKFPGADGGVYHIALIGEGVGRIDKTPLVLTCESKVTAIAPLTGSYLGGTVVTITGTNYSTNKLDNPVKVGNNWCDVLTTEATKITCRVRETRATATGSGPVSTFLRTQEEATVQDGVSKTFTFATPAETVTGLTSAFDATTNTIKLTLAGTGFGTDKSKVTLMIDGATQTALTLTAT